MVTRVQRRRTKGWRMPPGAVYVGRPTVWGNPYRVVLADDGGCTVIGPDLRVWYPTKLEAQRVAVTAYRAWLAAHHSAPALLHHVDPAVGLTASDFAALTAWTNNLGVGDEIC